MKHVKLLLVCILFVGFSASSFAQAKTKFGHINSNDLLLAMPERASAEAAIQAEAKKLELQLQTMSKEYEAKLTSYQSEAASMSTLIKQTKEREIMDLQQRIQEFQVSAQEDLQVKEQELLQPLIEKAKTAIEDVAKENGFTYIFDSSLGVLLYMPEGDDVMPLVKKKLGIQ